MAIVEIDQSNPCNSCPLNCRPIVPVIPDDFRFLVVVGKLSSRAIARNEFLPEQALEIFRNGFAAVGFKKKDFAFTSAVLCAYDPDQYSTNDNKLIQRSCKVHLDRCIESLQPEIIIPAGAEAAKAVLGRSVKITKARGLIEYSNTHNVYVIPTQELSYIANYPQHIPLFESDCRVVKRLCDNDFDPYASQQELEGDYKEIDDLQFLIDMEPERLAIDLETSGLRDYEDNATIYTIQLSIRAGQAWVLPWDHPESNTFASSRRIILPNAEVSSKRERLIEQLRVLLQNPKTRVGNANLKFDAGWVYRHFGFRFRIDTDVITLAKELDENLQRADLDTLTKLYAQEMGGYADRFNATYDKSRMDLVPLKELVQYGGGDVDAVMRIWGVLEPRLYEDYKAWVRYRRVVMPAYNSILVMENQGVDINEEAIEDFQQEMTIYVEGLHKSLVNQIPAIVKRDYIAGLAEAGKKVTGDIISLRKKDLLQQVLFSHPNGFRLTPKVFTKKTTKLSDENKVPSLSSKDHLPYFFGECSFTMELAEWVKMDRLLSTNVVSFRNKYVTHGRVYPRLGMDRAVTGRSNSYDPNCFPGVVEVLTTEGWKLFSNTDGTEKVAQYDFLTKEISFAEPLDYIQQYFEGELVSIANDCNMDIISTANHRFSLLSGEDDTQIEVVAKEYPSGYLQPHSGIYVDGRVSYSAWQVVIICAAQVDSIIMPSGALVFTVTIGSMLHTLVDALEHEEVCFILATKNLFQAHVYIPECSVPEYIKDTRTLGSWVLSLDVSTLELFCNTIPLWYGTLEPGSVCCLSKSAAEYIQIMYTLSGHVASVDQRSSKYVIRVIRQTTHLYVNNPKVGSTHYSGKVYCYTMPKDSLIVRYYGRVCITNNSQNYPARGKQAKAYKKLFIPPEGKIFLAADLSQAELRIAADMSRDKLMCKIYQEGGDIHKHTACIVMGVTLPVFLKLPKDEQDLARFKAKACIAEGQLVLTDHGLVPIEKVQSWHKVWDGIEWVTHEGVVFQGYREVIEYEGLIATPDHKVYTEDGTDPVPFWDIASKVCDRHIAIGEINGVPHRYLTPNAEGREAGAQPPIRRSLLCSLQKYVLDFSRQHKEPEDYHLPLSKEYKVRRRPKGTNIRGALRLYGTTLPQRYPRIFAQLQGPWYSSSIRFERAFCKMGASAISRLGFCWTRLRQEGQRWALHTRQLAFSTSPQEPTEQEYYVEYRVEREASNIKRLVQSLLPVCRTKYVRPIQQGPECGADSRAGDTHSNHAVRKVEDCTGTNEQETTRGSREPIPYRTTKRVPVYDIVNAGPRHRFTVSGKVVSNCNFGFLYGMGWRKFIIYAKTQYGIEFTENEARRIRDGFFNKYASLSTWHERVRALAREQLWVRAYTGKVRHLPMLESDEEYIRAEAERQAVNSPVQCTASDLGIIAMSRIDQEIRPECLLPAGFVHDADYVITSPQYVEWGARTLKYYMESTPMLEWFGINMVVPIKADVSFGYSMGELYEIKNIEDGKRIDFRKLEEENDLGFRLPRQVTPSNNGLRAERPYAEIEIELPEYDNG